MKKRLLSLALIVVMLASSVVVFAEDFTRVEKLQFVDGLFELSFSNGIFRTFEESKKEIKVLSDEKEEKIELNIKDEGKGKEKSKTFTLKIEEIKEGKEYKLVIGKGFKANNGKSLEADYEAILETLNSKKEKKAEEKVTEIIESEEAKEIKEEKVIETPFKDIKGNKAEKQIGRLYKKELIKGKTETEFRPEDDILLVEGISILVRYLNLEEMEEIEEIEEIEGLSKDLWYREDVLKAVKKGIISSKDILRLNEKIKLKELSDILFNLRENLEFKAENIEDGRDLVREILSNNYDENTKIEGKKELTRADFATIFGNLIKK